MDGPKVYSEDPAKAMLRWVLHGSDTLPSRYDLVMKLSALLLLRQVKGVSHGTAQGVAWRGAAPARERTQESVVT